MPGRALDDRIVRPYAQRPCGAGGCLPRRPGELTFRLAFALPLLAMSGGLDQRFVWRVFFGGPGWAKRDEKAAASQKNPTFQKTPPAEMHSVAETKRPCRTAP